VPEIIYRGAPEVFLDFNSYYKNKQTKEMTIYGQVFSYGTNTGYDHISLYGTNTGYMYTTYNNIPVL
jgi:hypothetical protein